MLPPTAAARPLRRGTASVELAILLPFLMFLFVISVDYGRIFYCTVTLQNCARNGAYYASQYPNANYIYTDIYGYTNLDDAVLHDATNLKDSSNPSADPKYTAYYSASADGPFTSTTPIDNGYVQVTVNWSFHSITHYPGVPSTVAISRTVIMRMSPVLPTFQ